MSGERTIRVQARGSIRIPPDLTRLTLTLTGVFPSYEEAMSRSAGDTADLRQSLAALGFEPKALKTLSFQVDSEYESVQDDKGRWQQQFVGYRFTHGLKLEFPVDNDLLGRVLYALAHGEARPEFHLSYTVSDPEAVKKALIADAVKNGRAEAETLAEAAGVRLGALASIDYSHARSELEVQPMGRALLAKGNAADGAGSYALDIQPEDITASDAVIMTWLIGS